MADWGPVFISLVLFILLSPGLLFQIPGKNRLIEFGNFQTSGVSILIHALIFFSLTAIFLIAIGVHMYMGT
jgi:cytochrome b subunit of formate dehydrogenase